MPVFTRDGVALQYDRVGNGPPVLLLHAWTTNRGFWARQVAALRDRWTTIAVDLRGHGASSRPRHGYTLDAMVHDLERLLASLGAPRVALVGWSMGGVLAAALADRLGARATALGLIATTAGALDGGSDPARAAAITTAMDADFRGFMRGFAASFFAAGAASPLYPWVAGEVERTAPHAARACFETFLAADLRARLPALRVPTVVVHGRHDVLVPVATAEAVTARIPGARLVVCERSGHAPLLEEPAVVGGALRALLDTTSG